MNKNTNKLLIYILSCTVLLVVYLYSPIESVELYQNTYNFSKQTGRNDNQSMQISIPIFESVSQNRKYKIQKVENTANKDYNYSTSAGVYTSKGNDESPQSNGVFESFNAFKTGQINETQIINNYQVNGLDKVYNHTRNKDKSLDIANNIIPDNLTIDSETGLSANGDFTETVYNNTNENLRFGIISPGDDDIDPTPIPIGDSSILFFLSVCYIFIISQKTKLQKTR